MHFEGTRPHLGGPEIYEALEERGLKYAIRIPANENLERDVAELLPRPVGRPSIKPLVEYKGFLYQAASWKTARRVVAKVEQRRRAGVYWPVAGKVEGKSWVTGPRDAYIIGSRVFTRLKRGSEA